MTQYEKDLEAVKKMVTFFDMLKIRLQRYV